MGLQLTIETSADATISLSQIDESLAAIAPHARGYPPAFESDDQSKEIKRKFRDLLSLLDTVITKYPDDDELLFRVAFANGMGHNLDFPGCAQKAIKAYDQLLALKPDNRRANFYYGAFLSGTTLFAKSVPYLRRAIELGEQDAHFTLAFVYLKQNNSAQALSEFKAYLVVAPENETAKKMVSNLESGKSDL
jgi:tetratricopeptide (TPR) repeat protein